ncbi:hypothetical protein P154DRAFT_522113 [Amniculicola lignicola CBS 123094]|uniref:Uncharacterized protein n=1 Tax=Amniculicola lignicola CBS 123094 TaxID=1392246 RepID=A0A6A5WP13_9PLEO|nr:hypothetical protein P154DRAFT_522113 [Amniculicola lignicola CBS 123094]
MFLNNNLIDDDVLRGWIAQNPLRALARVIARIRNAIGVMNYMNLRSWASPNSRYMNIVNAMLDDLERAEVQWNANHPVDQWVDIRSVFRIWIRNLCQGMVSHADAWAAFAVGSVEAAMPRPLTQPQADLLQAARTLRTALGVSSVNLAAMH